MDEKQRQQIQQMLGAFLRRKKIIFSSLLLAIVAGVAVYLVYPKSYQATALLVYQRQQVGSNKMMPDARANLDDIVSNLKQQVTSRASLEGLINRFHLYPELRKTNLIANVVAVMRQAIQIHPARRGDAFQVTYEGRDPRQVMGVTNALSNKFIEENLRFREAWTSGNLAYIKNELRAAKKTLDHKDAVMRDYKMKYYNEMPEQRDTNMARLNALQNQYQHLQNNIQEQERNKILVQEQITFRQNMQAASEGDQKDLLATDNNLLGLAAAKRKLAILQGRYTDLYPDIVRLKALINKLGKSAATSNGTDSSASTALEDRPDEELRLQIKRIDMGIGDEQKEMARIQKQMKTYQAWIDAAPVRGAEWASLTRDYSEFRKYYEELLSQSLVAKSANTLENQQKGSQFRIVDSAGLPDKPFRPNFFLFMSVAAMAGLGLGGGVSFLLETFDTSFKDAADLESYLGLPVTCSIPLVYTEQEKRQLKMRSNLWAAAFGVALLIITSGIIALWVKQLIII